MFHARIIDPAEILQRTLFRKQRDFFRLPAQIPASKIPSMSISNCASAKLDEPRLVGMKGEPAACEP